MAYPADTGTLEYWLTDRIMFATIPPQEDGVGDFEQWLWDRQPFPDVLRGVISGDAAWGHVTGVAEDNTRTFVTNWTGTGRIRRAGDDEFIALSTGEYMESEIVNTGVGLYEIDQNFYIGADDVTLKFKHAATQAACEAAAFGAYTVPFDSLGFVQIRVESTL